MGSGEAYDSEKAGDDLEESEDAEEDIGIEN